MNREDYDKIEQGDKITVAGLRDAVMADTVTAQVTKADGTAFDVLLAVKLSAEDRKIILAGGRLNM